MAIKITNCQFCGMDHGVQCPAVKAIEYFPNGTIKRVEFKTAADYTAPMSVVPPLQYSVAQSPWPSQLPIPSVLRGNTWDDGIAIDPAGRPRC